MKWFMYDPGSHDERFTLYETWREAKQAAQQALDSCAEIAGEGCGWPEDVDKICWGVLGGQVNEVGRRPAEDGDEYVDYELGLPL